jgi:hypothetical protein
MGQRRGLSEGQQKASRLSKHGVTNASCSRILTAGHPICYHADTLVYTNHIAKCYKRLKERMKGCFTTLDIMDIMDTMNNNDASKVLHRCKLTLE